MDDIFMQEILRQAPFGYAYHKLLLNDSGEPEDYIFLEVNSAFEEMTGLISHDIIGNKVTKVLSGIRTGGFDWVFFYGKIAIYGGREEFSQYSEQLRRWYKITAFSPQPQYFVTIFQDITLEMKNIASLETQKKEIEMLSNDLEIIFNSTQDAMYLVAVEMGDFRYIRSNAVHQRLTGFSLTDIKGKTPVELTGIEIGEQLRANYQKCVDGRRPYTYEETLVFPAGERNWLTTITPVLDNDIVKYLVGSKKDITMQKKAEEERNALLLRFQTMLNEHAAVMLLVEPITGQIMYANPAACSFYGYSRKELLGLGIHDINVMTKEEIQKNRLRALNEEQKYFIFPHRLKSGAIRLVDVYSCPITHDGQKMLFSIVFDVTDREKFKDELHREKELLRTTFLSIGDGVVTTDNEGIINSLNKAAEEITGWHNVEARGQFFSSVFNLISGEQGKVVEDPVVKVLRTGKVVSLENNTSVITKGGQYIPIADSAAPIKNEKGEMLGVVMVFRDVTKEKQQQEEIIYLSYNDHLTGLYNRRFMETEIKRLDTSRKLPLAVIMGDVNGLKLTNDIFGHQAGDKLLQDMAKVLTQNCRQGDIIVRWGGDEFLILLPLTTAKIAEKLIERIKNSCSKKNDSMMQLSISLGYAVKTQSEENILQILQAAEERMYHQKLLEGRSYRDTIISALLATLFEKSMETEEHAGRLKDYCHAIGCEIGLSAQEMDDIILLAMLHDIGKVAVKESILKKPGTLSAEEWTEVKKHPEIGYRIAQNSAELSTVAEYILSHHERWDGDGYPQGLKGKDIPLLCRILAVADAYDAMTNDRVYRKAMDKEKALSELKKNSGTQFDPQVTGLFIRLLGAIDS